LGSVLALLTALGLVVMPSDTRQNFFFRQRKYVKSGSYNEGQMKKLFKAFGVSFATDIFKAGMAANFQAKFIQLYNLLCDGGTGSHYDDIQKLLLKLGGSLQLTTGQDSGVTRKEILHKINCEGKIILINGTGTGALTGVAPDTLKKTKVYHQNVVTEAMANLTLTFYEKDKADWDLLESGLQKVAEKWDNGEMIARVTVSATEWSSDAAVRAAMLPLATDFDKAGHPTRPPTEKEVESFLALFPGIQKKLNVIQSNLKKFSPRSCLDEKKFAAHLGKLDDFIKKNGNMSVPRPTEKGAPEWKLFNFVQYMRDEYKKFESKRPCRLTEDRVRQLNERNFCWDEHARVWQLHFERLEEYQRINGNCNIVSANGVYNRLALWVQYNRRLYTVWEKTGESNHPDRMRKFKELTRDFSNIFSRPQQYDGNGNTQQQS
jgi:hypothetical protein